MASVLFKTKRRKKGLTSVQEEERYRVVTVDEKVRLLDTVHKDPAGGHFGVHKTYVVLYVVNVNCFHYRNYYINNFFLVHTVKTYTCKSLLPKFNTPLPEEISPVLLILYLKGAFMKKRAKKFKHWKKPLPAFVDR